MKHSTYNSPMPQEKGLNLREVIAKYLRYWPWFILSVLIAIVIARVYLHYTPLSYQTTASILIKDEKSSNVSQLAIFQDLGVGDKIPGINLENEIEILNSRAITEKLVRKLKLNIRYFFDGRINSVELFEKSPIVLEVLTEESKWPLKIPSLTITPISPTKFIAAQDESEEVTGVFGQEFEYKKLRYLVHSTENLKTQTPTRVSINSIARATDQFRSSLQVALQGKMSSIITINHVSELPNKSQAIIDELILLYNQDAIRDRGMVSKNTAEFIDERLGVVWSELDSVELNKVKYKQTHNLIDLQTQGGISLESASESNRNLMATETELSQIRAMISYLQTGEKSSLLPSSLGVSDAGLMNLIQQYNQVVMQRNQLLIHSTETHPTVVSLTGQLVDLKANVLESLQRAKSSLEIKLNDLMRQDCRIGGQLAGIPSKERDFTTIERQQEIKQSLYLYLLQKREEATISLAVTEPKAKIVDAAYTPVSPIAPKPKVIMLAAVFLGGLIPFGTIYVGGVLDNKIRNRKDVTSIIPDASILAEIPELSKKDARSVVKKNDLGVVAESFRVLRTNLQFAGVTSKGGLGKCIIVTSSIKGEGKTMVSVNLAMTLAHAGNKVLLIGGDIRNPKLTRFFSDGKEGDKKGLVEYLIYEDSSLDDYTLPSTVNENLNILHSGTIPPNPAELLLSSRVGTLIDEAKTKFDYLVIDTAPTLMVTDTLLLSKFADATLYVIRAGYTKKQILEFARDLKEDKKLTRVNYVLNSVSSAEYGYGGGYGHGYGYGNEATKKSFWKRLSMQPNLKFKF